MNGSAPTQTGSGGTLEISQPRSGWFPFYFNVLRGQRTISTVLFALLLFTFAARANTTNDLSDSEMQGRALAEKILEQRPTQNYTNTGILDIRSENDQHRRLPITCETTANVASWENRYMARFGTNAFDITTLIVTHSDAGTNRYLAFENGSKIRMGGPLEMQIGLEVRGNRTMIPFAGSDFWFCDLGLEFFHWPQQKVVKKEFHRQCPCTVLESTNPNPSTNAYSRVVCWIDDDSLGIVEAYAYDANGKKLKNFYPKNFQKVNGQYQVESMVMKNLQTGSKSTLEFDLDK
jgi:hypothetical protein